MAASCRRLSPYFTAAPGGDKEHRGERDSPGEERKGKEREERRGEECSHSLDNRPSLSHHVQLACQSNSGLLNFTLNRQCSSPCQSLRDFRHSTKAKEHNEWKAPSQIDFKLNQTLNSIICQSCRWGTFKLYRQSKREREGGEKVRRGKEDGRSRMQMTPSLCGVRTGGPVVALGLMNELLKWSPLLPLASGSSNSA